MCRGEATAEDLKGPATAPGSKRARGDWMTELPLNLELDPSRERRVYAGVRQLQRT